MRSKASYSHAIQIQHTASIVTGHCSFGRTDVAASESYKKKLPDHQKSRRPIISPTMTCASCHAFKRLFPCHQSDAALLRILYSFALLSQACLPRKRLCSPLLLASLTDLPLMYLVLTSPFMLASQP